MALIPLTSLGSLSKMQSSLFHFYLFIQKYKVKKKVSLFVEMQNKYIPVAMSAILAKRHLSLVFGSKCPQTNKSNWGQTCFILPFPPFLVSCTVKSILHRIWNGSMPWKRAIMFCFLYFYSARNVSKNIM